MALRGLVSIFRREGTHFFDLFVDPDAEQGRLTRPAHPEYAHHTPIKERIAPQLAGF